jgi:CheY-like chemotaxis protein
MPDSFDVVVTDMTMPQMTGIDLAKEILKVRSDIPIILCTGFSETVDESKSKLQGIRELLMKPVSLRDLAEAVSKVLVAEKSKVRR